AHGAAAGYQLSEVISNLAQGTKSYFDSLTTYALEQLYGPDLPAAAPGGAPKDPEARKATFMEALRQAGITKDQATNVVTVWTASGIPLNTYAAPIVYNSAFEFREEDKIASRASHSTVIDFQMENGERMILKCFPPTSEMNYHIIEDVAGIDAQHPRLEARCLLASHIAHDILGWDILPKASMGYFSGRACLMTPRIEGMSLLKKLRNNVVLEQVFFGSIRDGIVHMDEWGDHFGPEFKQNYLRLSLFNNLVADSDRHYNQFLSNAKGRQPAFLKGFDWDLSFGSKMTTDVISINPVTRQRWALWPHAIPQAICDEFGKVNEANLREAATLFEMTEGEVAALISRFNLIKKKLAVIKKS
ncbi:hypothetical protein, partial [Hydrogenophaga sp.]|uniref:hypothetical protein n=1 Tax=Hydrogenophaga sp. TaxID=1904254 RepID=UPI002FC70733